MPMGEAVSVARSTVTPQPANAAGVEKVRESWPASVRSREKVRSVCVPFSTS